MPELPEVETTRRGIAPYVEHRRVDQVLVREPRLRWPVPAVLGRRLRGQIIDRVERRAKYLLFRCAAGTAILHLGMSGSLRVIARGTAAQPHDHVDLILAGDHCLRLRDPRRFGALLWTDGDPLQHPLLRELGPEPLGPKLTGDYLYATSERRRAPVKNFLMDSHVLAGVGNIYANEALFAAGIHPARPAGRIARARYARLAMAVREVLRAAIAHGGTTLRDFLSSDGRPGYFRAELNVYGRVGAPCPACGTSIRLRRLGQRATYYCPRCQR